MTREETAEWVGYYFGLTRAFNMKRLPSEFVRFLDVEMREVEARLSPDTINNWPRSTPILSANDTVDGESTNG